MTRRQWMWLWIWLLLFFIIFCVWNKLQTLGNNDLKVADQAITIPAAATAKAVESISKSEIEKEDINFKVIKDEKSIKVSGHFSSKEDVDALKTEYLKFFDNVDEGVIVINENAQNSKMVGLITDSGEDFSKFKSGYLEYVDGKFTIDGIVDDDSIKQSIEMRAKSIENLSIDNKVIIDLPKIDVVEVTEPKVQEKEVETPSKEEIQAKLNSLLKLKKVEFIYGKALLTDTGKKTINEVYTVLNEYKKINVEVGGHTDSRGSQAMNKSLSQSRATTIKNYLISKGIDSKRLKAVGYGENKPLVKNDSSKNRQINRRVEFKILGE